MLRKPLVPTKTDHDNQIKLMTCLIVQYFIYGSYVAKSLKKNSCDVIIIIITQSVSEGKLYGASLPENHLQTFCLCTMA